MNKAELTDRVQKIAGVKKQDVTRVLDALVLSIADAMKDGEDVSIRGFGAFRAVDVAERKVCPPDGGEALTIPAHRAAKFYPTKSLKAYINPEAGNADLAGD